jgi:hypothetical protein
LDDDFHPQDPVTAEAAASDWLLTAQHVHHAEAAEVQQSSANHPPEQPSPPCKYILKKTCL